MMARFIWSKVQVESGLSLPQILVLKEAERLAGNGVFWWGIGTALDRRAVERSAVQAGGTLPVLFSLMLSRPKNIDVNPDQITVWTQWEGDPTRYDLPRHVLEFSRAHGRPSHYALCCRSAAPLALASHPFNPGLHRNLSGKALGSSQVTALLEGDIEDKENTPGIYHFGFRATLVEPWFVKLVNPRLLRSTDKQLYDSWKEEWRDFAVRLKTVTD